MRAIDVVVVIVSYKSAELAVECLRSVESERRSSELRIRAVVVDNASGDAAVIARAIESERWNGWARLLVAERNGGFGYGNNLAIGFACAAGPVDYVHLLNPDTVLRPGAILELARFLESRPGAGIAGGIFENADRSEWAIAFRFPTLLGEIEQGVRWRPVSRLLHRWRISMPMGREVQAVDWVSGASMMIRRTVLARIGGFDESFFLYFEETEFCHRAKLAGFEVWYVPQSRVMHIAGQSTNITKRDAAPPRLPAYWFESRRRFFLSTRNLAYAVGADIVTLAAHALGWLKATAQGRRKSLPPHFFQDLARHSLLRASNRKAAAREAVVPRF